MNSDRTVLVKANPKRLTRLFLPIQPSVHRSGTARAANSGATPEPVPQRLQPPTRPSVVELTPADAASETCHQLQHRWGVACRAASAQARLRKADIYRILKTAYKAVRVWKKRGIHWQIARLLKRTAGTAISRESGLFLVLLRSALPNLDPKRASKWAAAIELAARHQIPAKEFVAFLEAEGGIEGAAKRMAQQRKLDAKGPVRDSRH